LILKNVFDIIYLENNRRIGFMKIIYSKEIAEKLIDMGYAAKWVIAANANHPGGWVFEETDEFKKALAQIVGK
jgi:hypothetical protein